MYPVETEQLWKVERLATIGEATTAIMHELNNRLTVVMGYAEMLCAQGEGLSNGEYPRALRHSCEQCCRLAREVLAFAKGGTYRIKKDLRGIVVKAVESARDMLDGADIKVRLGFSDERMEALVSEVQVRQVVFSIIRNACHELTRVERRTIEITGWRERDRAVITFSDSGPGIRDEDAGRIFDPFYTTRNGEGTGLGLSMARRIAEEHGGSLHAERGVGAGARFVLILPLAEGMSTYIRPGTVSGDASGSRLT
ncbi:MAG: HAMP domain-containing histidine kinase [Chlamydiae bacterium]|nr:HAMP domain-containing histidine kinase [Chlamydiota bacterium]